MAENRAVDGSLVFDTKINFDGYKRDLDELEKLSETDIQVTGKAVLDKSEFESEVKELDRKVEKAVDTVTVETAVDDTGLKTDIAELDDAAKKAVQQLEGPLDNGTLTFDTKIDQTGYKKGLATLENITGIALGNIGANLFQAGMEKLVDGVKKGVGLASDLEEVQNVVDVTFGEGAAQIEAFAESASTAFGLTELQAKQFTGTIGAMVKSMGLTEKEALEMSTSLVGLTGDMASFYNLDHETAFEKIRSGISGEVEPLKQLGINMSVANLEAYALSKGIKTAYDKMSEAEKVQLRYGYIMQQTTDAQGDFVRTQDSYANQVRILQNNLDTLAANVGGMLIPALTSAIGWMNSLFAGPTVNETQAAIDDAVKSLEKLDDDVQDIKNNYTREAIKIQIDYQKAEGLADDLDLLRELADRGYGERTLRLGMTGDDVAALQNQLSSLGLAVEITDKVGVFGQSTEAALKEYQGTMGLVEDGIAGAKTYAALSAEDTEKLVKVTNELVNIYPELAKYVGKDGVLTAEGDKVDELIESYKDLALYKLMASKAEAIGGEYLDAAVNMKLLEEEMKIAQGELDELTEKAEAYNRVAQTFTGNYAVAGKRNVQAELDAINEYIRVFGSIDDAVEAASQNGVDLNALFGMDGVLKSAEEITSVKGGLEALTGLFSALYSTAAAENRETAASVLTAQQSVDTAKQAIEEFKPVLDSALNDYNTALSALDTYAEEIGKDIGEALGKDSAKSLEEQSGKVADATEDVIDIAQRAANKKPIRLSFSMAAKDVISSYSVPGHATGLDRVPYDNYLARLHVGESVLTASEAQRWRESKGGGGITPAQLTAAMEPVVEAIGNIRIALDIDGREFASSQAAHNRIAQNRYNTQIAKGMGK